MRTWLRCGIALLCGSGLIAVADGWFQGSIPQPVFRHEMMGFFLLSAWIVSFPLWLVWGLFCTRLDDPSPSAFWAGLAVGVCPMAVAWVPLPFNFGLAAILLGLGLLPQVRRYTPPSSLRLVLACALGLFLAASPFLPQSDSSLSLDTYRADADPRPVPEGIDVFLVSVDTLRADVIVDDRHTPGDSTAPTPFLDGQRPHSLWADYALSCSNQTLPGHVGMLTGCDAMEHGVRSNRDRPDPGVRLVAEVFQDAGWRTMGVISNALLSAATNMNRGFDSYSDKPIGLASFAVMLAGNLQRSSWSGFLLSREHTNLLFRSIFFRSQMKKRRIPLAERVTDVALRQMEEAYADPRPFFHFLHFMDPHTNYHAAASLRGSLSRELATQVAPRFLPGAEGEITNTMVRQVQDALQARDPDAALAARYYHLAYLEEMAYVDLQLQRIFEVADASGRPYVVLFTADHGEQFGEHGLMDHANSLFEKNLQVPFQLWGAGVRPGHLQAIPHLADVAPTLLHLAGLEVPDAMTGRVVLPDLMNRPHVAVDQKEVVVRDAAGLKWTGSWPEDQGASPTDRRLVDLAADPGEQLNLLAAGTPLPNTLQRLLDGFLDRDRWSERQSDAKRSAAQEAALSQLGYADQQDDR